MAGIISPSMPVWVVENRAQGNRAYCNFNEGLGKVLRFGNSTLLNQDFALGLYSREQAGRVFGCIAAGLSIGGLVGSALAGLLAAPLGSIHLLLVAAAMMGVAAVLMRVVIARQRPLGSPGLVHRATDRLAPATH